MPESASALTPLHPPEGRQYERTHMFVAATLYSGASSCPVHIRNMSLTGALVEGAKLPDVGAEVMLRRGPLEAEARISWRVERKAGVAFAGAIHVADWMSRNPSPHQTRVDEIVRDIRSGRRPGPMQDELRPALPNGILEAELHALRAELMALEKGLTGDVIAVATHPEIQLLDVALQRVGRMLKGAKGP